MTDHKRSLVFFEYLSLAGGLSIAVNTLYSNEMAGLSRDSGLLLSIICCTLVLLYGLEFRIANQLKFFKFREGASAGLWTCCLLPLSLLITLYYNEKGKPQYSKSKQYFWRKPDQTQHKVLYDRNNLMWMWYCTSLCTGTCSLFIIAAICGSHDPRKLFRSSVNAVFCAFLICIGVQLLYLYAQFGMKPAIFLSATSQLIFLYCTWNLPIYFPRAFSLGEVFVISQAIASFVACAAYDIIARMTIRNLPTTILDQVVLFVEVSLLGCVLVIITCSSTTNYSTPSMMYLFLSCFSVALFFVLPILRFTLRGNPFMWVYNFLGETNNRLSLLGLWLILLLMSFLYVYSHSKLPYQPTTVMRKYFHLMILGVYFPGLIFDQIFLRFCASLLLGVIVVLEFIRYFEIPPISDVINNNIKFFLDDKDQGPLILSHIYLLIGCSIPVWFASTGVVVYGGILSVGIGDAFASIGGTAFGRTKWLNTNKTLEGTISSIVAQMMTVHLLIKTNLFPPLNYSYWGIIVTTSFLEAFTTQVDNLVIPFVFYMLSVIVTS